MTCWVTDSSNASFSSIRPHTLTSAATVPEVNLFEKCTLQSEFKLSLVLGVPLQSGAAVSLLKCVRLLKPADSSHSQKLWRSTTQYFWLTFLNLRIHCEPDDFACPTCLNVLRCHHSPRGALFSDSVTFVITSGSSICITILSPRDPNIPVSGYAKT